jgi:Cu2+-exporting ATPase
MEPIARAVLRTVESTKTLTAPQSADSLELPCEHCGLPVPAGLIERGTGLQFCCSGCRVAFDIIQGSGLERYYRLRERIEAPMQPARPVGRSFEEFDDPAFVSLYGRSRAEGHTTIDLYLEGVHCAACVWLVERVPAVILGVVECRLDLGRSMAQISWDPSAVELSRVARFLDSIGYPPHPVGGIEARELERRADRSLMIRIAVAGAVAGNIMLLAFALYGGLFGGIEEEFRRLFRWTSMVLSLPSVIWCAAPFYRGAWGALRTRRLHMDVPITIGILAGFLWGCRNTILATGEIYFDSVTVLIFLLLVGRFVQRRQQRRAARATEMLFSLAPSSARIIEDGDVREVPVAVLAAGDLVELRAGDTAPADGVVSAGSSTLDLSLLTGESRPVDVDVGDPIHAGTVNLSGRLVIRVETTGESTRIGRLLALVEESARRRAPVVQLADRISAWFVAAVLLLAAVTALIWSGTDRAVDHAVALLIVSCPCALGLATPLAVAAAIGNAARSGILIKGGDALERLVRPGRMFLDKTGTLTEGRLAVVQWYGEPELRRIVAAIEAHSSHPIARALADWDEPSAGLDIRDVKQHPGQGVTAICDGRSVTVGSASFVVESGTELSEESDSMIRAIVADGMTPIVVALDNAVAAIAALGDPVRVDTPSTLDRIRRIGWRLEVLSGDHPGTVRAVMSRIGLEHGRGGANPEDKAEIVHQASQAAPTVMVGDGVNDAAALAAAAVGVGVHGGAEAALAAADVFLSEPGLSPIVRLLEGARRTLGVIRRNLVFSLAYNVVAVTLAMSGHMHPLIAAILMPLSSITVVVSSYKARTFSSS